MPKSKLNYWDLSDQVLSMMKTRQDNDMTNHIDTVYAKNDIELLWPIEPIVDCDKNQIGQLHD